MNILVTGHYNPGYNRNRILLNGLRNKGIRISEAPYLKKKAFRPDDIPDLSSFDFVFLPSFTHYDVRFIKRKLNIPLVFDPLISRYLTKTSDLKNVRIYSPRALKNYLKDRVSMERADIVLADTEAHRKYFIDTFGIDREKIHVVPVGVDIETFKPAGKNEINATGQPGTFLVGTYSSYLPLHGIEKIIDAAEMLRNERDIKFHLIGKGGLLPEIRRKIEKLELVNVELIDWLPYEKLPAQLALYDLCLGIFGDSLKAKMVIPNKIYHFCAVGKPVLTMDSPAIREIFTPGEDIVTTNRTLSDLAGQIMELKNDPKKRNDIALKGMQKIHNNYNQDKVAEKFLRALEAYQDR